MLGSVGVSWLLWFAELDVGWMQGVGDAEVAAAGYAQLHQGVSPTTAMAVSNSKILSGHAANCLISEKLASPCLVRSGGVRCTCSGGMEDLGSLHNQKTFTQPFSDVATCGRSA